MMLGDPSSFSYAETGPLAQSRVHTLIQLSLGIRSLLLQASDLEIVIKSPCLSNFYVGAGDQDDGPHA